MAARIQEVARAAGVSPSTVSRALTGSGLVSPATRDRVEQAAARLGYQPSRVARGLVTGRTGSLGLIVPDLSNPFFPGIVKGVQARVRGAHLSVFVADSNEDQAVEVGLIRELARQVDGVLLCSPRSAEEVIQDLASDAAIVLVNRRVGDLPAITVDNADGMRQAVAHLVALGHQRLGYVAGPAASWSGAQRLRGLRLAADVAGAELVELGNFPPYFEGGVAAADIAIAAELTAVIAYNDVVALGLISRFNVRGWRCQHRSASSAATTSRRPAWRAPPCPPLRFPRSKPAGRPSTCSSNSSTTPITNGQSTMSCPRSSWCAAPPVRRSQLARDNARPRDNTRH